MAAMSTQYPATSKVEYDNVDDGKFEPDVSGEQWVDLSGRNSKGIAEGKLVEGAPALVDGAYRGRWIPEIPRRRKPGH